MKKTKTLSVKFPTEQRARQLLVVVADEMRKRGLQPELEHFSAAGYEDFLNKTYPEYAGHRSIWTSRVKEAVAYENIRRNAEAVSQLRDTYERPLKVAMKKGGYTVKSLAAFLGCDHSALGRQMKGLRRWPVEHLLKLQEHFGIKFDGLPVAAKAYHDSLPYVRLKPEVQAPIMACGGEVHPVKFTEEQKTEAPALMSDDELLELLVIRYLKERPGLVDAVFPEAADLRKIKALMDEIKK